MKMVTLPILLLVMLAVTGGLPGAKASTVTEPPGEEMTEPGSESAAEAEETTNDDLDGQEEEPAAEPTAEEEEEEPAAEPTTEENAESGNETMISKEEHQVAKRSTFCPCGWSRCGNRCFRYFSIACSWSSAQRYCLARGATLASVHSAYEESFVRRLALNRLAWIGFSDAQQEHYWFWIDGTRVNYRNWCRGEPNNYRGNQDCVRINWGSRKCWDDGGCRDRHGFVCVRNP